METPTCHQLLDTLRSAGLLTDQQLSAAEESLSRGDDAQGLADQLLALGVLNNGNKWLYSKIRAGRLDELLFGPFLILDKIGEGGMGKVFKAIEIEKQRVVALKTIRPQLMTNKLVLMRYEREAKATLALNHPNVVAMYEVGDVNGRLYMSMEYVDGIDLSRIVKQFGHPPQRGLDDYQEACEYVRQAALGLQAAHDLGFVHRDIKPSNMLVFGERPLAGTNGKATVKLLDMGLVRRILENEESTRTELTRDGTVVGTPDYMAPEQAKNSSTVDHKADLYSLGCTLFYLIRGQPPFPDGNSVEKLIRHQLDSPPDLRPLRPDVPEGVHQVIEKLLKKKPEERYARASDVAAALAPFTVGGVGTSSGPASPTFAPFSFSLDPELSAPTVAVPKPEAPPTPVPGMPPKSGAISRPTASGRILPPAARNSPMTPASGIHTTNSPVTPIPSPRSGRATVRVVSAPGAAVGHVIDAEVVSALSSATPAPSSRPTTPISNPKLRTRRMQRPNRPKQNGPTTEQLVKWVAGAFVVIVGMIFAIRALSRGESETPATEPTEAIAPVVTGTTSAYTGMTPIGELLPAGTVAAAVIHSKDVWAMAIERRPPAGTSALIDDLVRRTRFDPRQFPRVTAAFTAKPGQYTVVGEGTFLTADWVSDTTAAFANSAVSERLSDGAVKLKFASLDSDPLLGLLVPRRGYALSNAPVTLGNLAESMGNKDRSGIGVSPDLLNAFTNTGADGPPLLTFAATAPWVVPGVNETLNENGVIRLVADVRPTEDGKFTLTLILTGKDKARLKGEFLDYILASRMAKQYPSLQTVISRVVNSNPSVISDGTLYEYKLSATYTWGELVDAIGPLLTAGPGW